MISSLPFSRQFCNRKSLQKQVSVMSMNLSCKLDDLQSGNRYMETSVALCEIRTQLQELTKSVESCQSEVSEVSSFPSVRNKQEDSKSAFLFEERPALFGTPLKVVRFNYLCIIVASPEQCQLPQKHFDS